MYNQKTYQSNLLTIPHPRISERDFVLKPLIDLGFESFVLNNTDVDIKGYLETINKSKCKRCVEFHGPKDIFWNNIEVKSFLMGILNMTPDSFSDGGRFITKNEINITETLNEIKKMISQGCDIIDIGGESTRPNATHVSKQDELNRISEVIEKVLKLSTVVSVDTLKPEVAKTVLKLGAHFINDVRGEHKGDKSFDDMFQTVSEQNKTICVMHNKGTSQTMNSLTNTYKNNSCLEHVSNWLEAQVNELVQTYYVPKWNIWIDPGIGFAKTNEQNWEVLNNIEQLQKIHQQVLLGSSRKRFLKALVGDDLKNLDEATAQTSIIGASKGCKLFRVHNIEVNRNALNDYDQTLGKSISTKSEI